MKWNRTTLGNFAPLIYGKGLPQIKRIPGSVPVYGSNGIVGTHVEAFVNEPAVIIGRKGSVGEVHLADGPSWPIDTAFYALGSKDVDLHFLYYLLKTLAVSSNSDSAVPGLNRDFAHSLEIHVPDIEGQIAIGRILSTLDQKIEANNDLSKTLEDIAQTIFKSWFIDFDPVKAKMAGEKPGGMDDATAALFPDSMMESELGIKPKEWKILEITELGKVVTGKTPSTTVAEYWGEDIPFVTIPDMHGTIVNTVTKRRLTVAGAESQKNQMLSRGSAMVSCIATPGLVVYATGSCQTNQQINSVIPKNLEISSWLYWHIRSLTSSVLLHSGVGTIFANLNKGDFGRIKSVVPPETLQLSSSQIFEPLLSQIESLSRENLILADIRDNLLPRLISGELQIPEEMLAS